MTDSSDALHPFERLLLGRRHFLALGGAALAGVALGGCGEGGEQELARKAARITNAAGGTEIRIVPWLEYTPPPIGHLNPYDDYDFVLRTWYQLVVPNPAFPLWKERRWHPLLVERWDFDRGRDAFVLTLKEGLRWSDGSPLTTADVWATYWCNRALGDPLWRYVDRIDVVDELTVHFHMKVPSTLVEPRVLSPDLRFVAAAQFGEFARRIETVVGAGKTLDSPEGVQAVAALTSYRPAELLASGPYKLDPASLSNSQLTLVRNPYGLFADQVHFDRIVVLNALSSNEVTPAMLRREIDYAGQALQPAVEKAVERQGYRIIRHPAAGGVTLLFNYERHKEFNDVRVRRAFAHVIDRVRNATVSMGTAAVAMRYTVPFPDHWLPDWLTAAEIGELDPYAHDLAQGEALLRGAGWTRRGRTWLKPDGQPARYELITMEATDWVSSARDVADQLSQFGIAVTARVQPRPKHWTDLLAGRCDLAIGKWEAYIPHPQVGTEFPLEEIKALGFEMRQQSERLGPIDLDALWHDTALGLDEAPQRAATAKLFLAFNELLPMVPLREAWTNKPVLEGVRAQGWPDDDDPIWGTSPNFYDTTEMLLLTGRLRPVSAVAAR